MSIYFLSLIQYSVFLVILDDKERFGVIKKYENSGWYKIDFRYIMLQQYEFWKGVGTTQLKKQNICKNYGKDCVMGYNWDVSEISK